MKNASPPKATARRALSQGLVAGLIGYLTFVAFFGVLNAATGDSPLTTPHMLGSALFGTGDPAGPPEAASVLAYSALHFLAAVLIGTAASILVTTVDLHPALWYLVMFLFVAGLLYSVTVGGIVANEMAGAVTWGQVVASNILAALTMGIVLWRAHPELRERVRRHGDGA